MSSSDAELLLYYWNIKARNYAILVVAQAGNVNLRAITEFDFPALKPQLPFGQLPYLVHGDIKMAQSNGILRYVAKLAGLQGDTNAEMALSEMLIEESTDLTNLLIRANYAPNKAEAFDELFKEEGAFAKQLTFLENLHPGNDAFFNAKRVAGEYALACILDIAIALEPSLLEKFPKLNNFYTSIMTDFAFIENKDLPMYYSRK